MVAGILASTGLATIAGAGVVSAQSADTNGDSLVQKIASKFGLNQADVQKVFDENRAEHQAQHEAKMQDRLAQAVKDGKLTQDQADKLTAKLKEMQTFMESLKDKTPAERHTAMKAKQIELQQWMKDNNIPAEFTHLGGGGHGHMGAPEAQEN